MNVSRSGRSWCNRVAVKDNEDLIITSDIYGSFLYHETGGHEFI